MYIRKICNQITFHKFTKTIKTFIAKTRLVKTINSFILLNIRHTHSFHMYKIINNFDLKKNVNLLLKINENIIYKSSTLNSNNYKKTFTLLK